MDNKEFKFGQECKYNPDRDICEVPQGLAVDITDALQTGVIKDTDYTEETNGISEPSQVLGRVSDIFDAIEASRAIKKYGKKADVISDTSPQSATASEAPKSE